MGFFGSIGAFLAVLAAIFFFPVLHTYAVTGLVPNFPTLIVCGFTMMAALQSFFAGLILQNMVQKNRQDFEMELLRVSEKKRETLAKTHPAEEAAVV